MKINLQQEKNRKLLHIIIYIFFYIILLYFIILHSISSTQYITDKQPGMEFYELESSTLNLKFLLIGVFVLSVLAIVIGKNTDFLNFNTAKAMVALLFILLIIKTVSFDLFDKIVTNVIIYGYQDSNRSDEIDPGETKIYEFGAYRCEFNDIEFFLECENRDGIKVVIENVDTEAIYLDREILGDEIITDTDINKIAVKISSSATVLNAGAFPMGKYRLSITNTGESKKIAVNVLEDTEGELNIQLRKNTFLGYYIAILMLTILSIYVVAVVIWTKKNTLDLASFFVVSIIPLSLIYLGFVLPWSTPDANAHFTAAYRWSNIVLGHGGSQSWLGRADDAIFYKEIWGPMPNHSSRMQGFASVIFNQRLFAQDRSMVNLPTHPEYMEYYSVFCYLPQVIGFVLGRILGLGPVPYIYMARLVTLIFYVGFCYRAIKRTPVGKSIFAIIPLLPISLMISVSFSYDVMVLISTLNFIAVILALYRSPDSKPLFIEACIWAFVIGAVKGGGYLILLPVAFVLFSSHKKKNLRDIICIAGSGFLSALLFDVLIPNGSKLFQFGTEGTKKMSAAFAIQHPMQYIQMWIATQIEYIDDIPFTMLGTKLGWMESTVPIIVVVSMVLVFGVYSLYEKDEIKFKQKDKWIFCFVIGLVLFFTPIMLLSATDQTSYVIQGVQGRYYLPVLPLVMLVLTKFGLHCPNMDLDTSAAWQIKKKCFRWCAVLSCVAIYFMARKYLTR